MADLSIEMVSLSDITPYENNPRAHSKKQVRALAASITDYGFNAPIIVDEAGVIINGHCRYLAAQHLEMPAVPVVRVTHLSEPQKRAYRVRDNQLGVLSQWDFERLAVEFEAIKEAGFELEASTAFSTAGIDQVLGAAAEAKGPDIAPEDIPAPGDVPAVTRPGDLWRLGEHVIACGDARDAALVDRLMGGEQARMSFADFPYNVPIDGFAVGKGVRHAEFAMASGEMSPEQFTSFLEQSLSSMKRVSMEGAILYGCMDWRHIEEMTAAAKAADLKLMNLIVWVKTNGGMGTFYRSRHELIFALKNGQAAHINNFELGQEGRNRTNVWEYRGANAFGPTRDEDLASHPTRKPVAMVADAIKDVSKRGEIVLDFFCGSGTTLIAAQMTGRRARVIELAPAYVDQTVHRWEKATGKQAVHAETGRTFEDEAEFRGVQADTKPAAPTAA
ncbi:MAG: site-specific DNA-methyltransferase [Hyphomonadaceae bacterium]